jgi:hypothetical protein
MSKSLFSCFVFLLLSTFSFAQEIIMITQPAAKKVGLQDAFEVKYIIKNANQVEQFSLPDLKDVIKLSGPTQSSQTSNINGEVTLTYELTYVMRAKRKGTIVIPGGIASSHGREYRSNNVTIEVIEGSIRTQQQQTQRGKSNQGYDPFDDPFFNQDPFAGGDLFAALQRQQKQMMDMLRQQQQMNGQQQRPQQQPRSFTPKQNKPEIIAQADVYKNIFIRVNVDKTNVKLGEQVTASYKLYSRLPMEVNLTKLPSLIGFWSQDFKIPSDPKPTKEIVNGKEYSVFEIKRTALFPTQIGKLELDAAQAEGRVQLLNETQTKEEDPFDSFFGGPNIVTSYGYKDVPVTLKSEAVQIYVSDLPTTNKPNSFQGAVGNYTLESNIDKTELTTDDNATITLRVSGTGNLKLIGAPKIKFPADIDPFDAIENDTITNTNNIIAGYKTFTYSFTPSTTGTFTIPTTDFSYFEPASGTYKTIQTPAYTIHVTSGKSDGRSVKNKVPKDIHDIQTKPQSLSKANHNILVKNPFYWSAFGFPILAYLVLTIFKRKDDKLKSNQTLYKHKRANKVALKRLTLAETYLKQASQNEFYEETSKAVWLYLGDKLSIPISQLSKDVAAEKMNEKKIEQQLQNELFRITNECEIALYAPAQAALRMQQTYSDTLRLIGKLEDVIV